MSPQLRSVREVGERAVGRKSRPWEITPADFFEDSEGARALFAEIIHGDAEGVAIIPSASYGLATAAANVPVAGGEGIVVLEEQFPSNVYPWRDLAKRTGARLVTVPRPGDHDWTAAVLDGMDARCAVVAVPNCHWTDGSRLDLSRVGERAREVGAALVVDATQSLGAHPLDVSEVKPDFLVTAAYKWMLGPYSLGFMHVGEGYREGVPLEQTWLGREGSEDFASLVEYRDAYAPGARRYDVGERSNFVRLPMAMEAMRRILEWGVANVAEGLTRLTGLIEEEAVRRGMRAIPAERRVGHMIGLGLDPGAPGDLAARLAAEGVYVSVRGRSLRVSPHLYNTERDVERLFDVLARHLP
ncbi:aminotransferase class V-fold PLP-dependent enzyme [Rubrobacter marinus]|uniref:Aminotransferase class V-fold PLP-dependent enzyme n=2 Tax=Rubrobacter marinus TaxID=2653852 RepID=A0A6G8Q2G2_9ACTN|nr:aminotransferase class V-fold PLP-dependent enzyme [Rubrobacter marinus]